MRYGIFKDNEGNNVSTVCMVSDTVDPVKEGCTLHIVSKSEFENCVLPEPLVYNAKTFLASCYTDNDMGTILAKLDAKTESRIITCLTLKNFNLLAIIINQLVVGEVITQSDATYFSTKLANETEVTLGTNVV